MTMLCLYFGNIRTKSNAGNMILMLEELIEANTGYSAQITKIRKEQRFWNKNWIDRVANILNDRKLTI